jgi:uncharacterized protein YifN (PemK superfamily)
MFNPYKLYRKSQDAQWQWIRNHPVQYVALNATLLTGVYGYYQYQDRKFHREMKADFDRRIQQD